MSPQDFATRARGLARQATETRQHCEKTLAVLREKEKQACLAALLAEQQLEKLPA
jgi:hypothetical protein